MPDPSRASPEPMAGATGKRRFFRNTGFSLLQTGVTMVLAVLLVPYLLWRLGTEQYGLWLTLQVFGILGLVALAELGLQGAVIRFLVGYHARADAEAFRRLLVTAFLLFAAIGVITSAALVVFAQTLFLDLFPIPEAYQDEMRLALSVYALGLMISFPGLILKACFAGTQDIATLKIWEGLDRILFTTGIVILLFFSERLLHMVLVEQFVMLVLFIVFACVARARLGDWFTLNPRHASRASLKGVGGLSGVVFATSISNQVYMKAPEALIAASLGSIALAHYQIATRIPRVLKSVQGALNAAVLPYVAGIETLDTGSLAAKRRFALSGLRSTYLLFVPIATFVIVFAPDILSLWVGAEFRFLGNFLALYAVWQLTSIIVGFGNATLTRTDHFRRLVWQNLTINALFLAALVFFLERYGVIAAFIALIVSGVATAASVLGACRTANGFSYGDFGRQVVLGPIIGAGLAGFALFAGAHFILHSVGIGAGLAAIAIAGLAYLLIIYGLILSGTERKRLRAVATLGKGKMRQA